MTEVDIIVPNTEKIFDQIKALFKRYYLLSKISLADLLSDNFLETFLKNGDLYLHSFNTRIDCDNCACLIPNGKLILNIDKSLNEKIPIKYIKKTVKSSGYEKYELHISLLDLRKQQNFDFIKKIFETIEFSFYAYWEPKYEHEDPRDAFNKVFGSKRVINCLNRIDSDVKICSDRILKDFVMRSSYTIEDWVEVDKIIGCLTNSIKLENFLPLETNENNSKKISYLRVKGFIPNKLVSVIMRDHIKPLIDREMEYKRVITNDTEHEFDRVVIKVHGFRDSLVSVVNLDHSLNQKMRPSEENFVCLSLNFSLDECKYSAYYKDFNKLFVVRKNK
ncbi:unnamed protein product [Brachionus calyciflorus]|uniref:Uncharacterized protein n=1 Tax=Brachionus calyciflorus TaxID=104777 RepID=A0A813MGS9_9BILA|nr:unnamed protein product [Brachionus calyciflorus]